MWKAITASIILLILIGLMMIWITFGLRSDVSEDVITIPNDPLRQLSEEQRATLIKESVSNTEKNQNASTQDRAFYVDEEDCNSQCSNFEKATEGWRYCANLCGIIDEEQNTDLCEQKDGLSRDYCFSEKAARDRDLDVCDSISDHGVRDICIQNTKEQIIDGF